MLNIEKSPNSFYYACSYEKVDGLFRIYKYVDNTMVAKFGEKFENGFHKTIHQLCNYITRIPKHNICKFI